MIAIMKHTATQNDIDYVVARANSLGLKTHVLGMVAWIRRF
jgi:hypothetical protein